MPPQVTVPRPFEWNPRRFWSAAWLVWSGQLSLTPVPSPPRRSGSSLAPAGAGPRRLVAHSATGQLGAIKTGQCTSLSAPNVCSWCERILLLALGARRILVTVRRALELGQVPLRAHEATTRTWRAFDGNRSLWAPHRHTADRSGCSDDFVRLCRAQRLWLVAGDLVLGCACPARRPTTSKEHKGAFRAEGWAARGLI